MPLITLLFKDKKIHDYPIAVGQSYTIGRKKTNDIVIDNLAVSGVHAKIESVATTFVLHDLDSTNGVFVNKEKITQRNLRHKDRIMIGKHELIFDRSDLRRKSRPEPNFDDDKTRILDTNDYRHLINKEKNAPAEKTVDPPKQETPKKSSFLDKLLKS